MFPSAPQRPVRVLRSHGVQPLPLDPRAGERPRAQKMATAKTETEPSSAAPSTSLPVQPPSPLVLTESSLTPAPFHGASTDNAQDWLQYFQRYVLFKQLPESAALALFALLMRGTANVWFTSLSDGVRNNYATVLERFSAKFAPAPISLWRRASELWSRDQRPDESVEQYFADMNRKAREVNASAEMTRYAVMKGLRGAYRTYVMQQNPTTLDALLEAAKVAEATVDTTEPPGNPEILEAINRLERRVSAPVTDGKRVSFRRPYVSPSRPSSGNRRDGRTSFNTPRWSGVRPPMMNASAMPEPTWYSDPTNPPGPSRNDWAQRPADAYASQARSPTPMGRRPLQTSSPQAPTVSGCTNCARMHLPGQCIARGKSCRRCGKRNHFEVCCRSAPRPQHE